MHEVEMMVRGLGVGGPIAAVKDCEHLGGLYYILSLTFDLDCYMDSEVRLTDPLYFVIPAN